ncbi:MAG: helix-turn-helix transcriptional regulator [Rikenellaceae bacterium]
MKERLSILLSVKGLTALKFAEIMNVQPSSISHLLSGRNNPNYDFILKLIERFSDISPDWLLLGQGDMFRKIDPTPVEKDPLDILEPLISPDIEEKEAIEPDSTKEEDSKVEEQASNAVSALPLKEGVSVTKVIIFYSDGTFESFRER